MFCASVSDMYESLKSTVCCVVFIQNKHKGQQVTKARLGQALSNLVNMSLFTAGKLDKLTSEGSFQ